MTNEPIDFEEQEQEQEDLRTHTLTGIYHLLTTNNTTEGKTQDDVKP